MAVPRSPVTRETVEWHRSTRVLVFTRLPVGLGSVLVRAVDRAVVRVHFPWWTVERCVVGRHAVHNVKLARGVPWQPWCEE